MDGFKNFLFRGNLVDLAVAVIIGTAFGAVVTAFTAWLTALMPDSADDVFTNGRTPSARSSTPSSSFVILAAVVYFLVVTPYVEGQGEVLPEPAPGTPEDIELLRQIRDLLAASVAERPARASAQPRCRLTRGGAAPALEPRPRRRRRGPEPPGVALVAGRLGQHVPEDLGQAPPALPVGLGASCRSLTPEPTRLRAAAAPLGHRVAAAGAASRPCVRSELAVDVVARADHAVLSRR